MYVKRINARYTFTDCSVTRNVANFSTGGGVFVFVAKVLIDSSTFSGNQAVFSRGGGICIFSGRATFKKSVFESNLGVEGGAIAIDGTCILWIDCAWYTDFVVSVQ